MKISKFQVIILAIMVICIIAGVVAFATYKGGGGSNQIPAITVWGTYPKAAFDQYVNKVNNSLASPLTVKYVQETQDSFLDDFVSALARGSGPDAVLIPADMLLPAEDKLSAIPYSVLPLRAFMDSFVDEASLYVSPAGVLGVPFSIDPMVMYWNRDLYNAAGIAAPPRYWDEFSGLNGKLTVKDQNGTITQSAVALGDFTNVANAREILATLLFQSGNPITTTASDGTVASAVSLASKANPSSAIQFFASFVDPSNVDYSWNRSWPGSETAFLSGDLATYFGFASELFDIRSKNPNLNFDAALMPQARSGGATAVYGRLYAFSIVKASQNQAAAFSVISALTSPQNLVELSNETYLPSVARAVIASGSTDPYITIFNQAALISKAWLDAGPSVSNRIFGSMVDSLTSGQKSIYQAVQDEESQYNVALRQAVGG